MKTLFTVVFLLLFSSAAAAQACQIPSLRGLKLGMTPAQVDAAVIVDGDKVYFDDVVYTLTFTRNKLVKIHAEYFNYEWRGFGVFVTEFAEKTGLPTEWENLAAAVRLERLQNEKALLISPSSQNTAKIKEIESQIASTTRNSPVLHCQNFSITAFRTGSNPQVVLRLTNNSKNKEFTP